MDIIIITILLIATLLSFAAFYIAFSDHLKIRKNKVQLYQNKLHFYVARDKDGKLYLYLGKPLRDYGEFIGDLTKGSIVLTGYHFNKFGLNKNDYAKLKWEDEPVEVFINLED